MCKPLQCYAVEGVSMTDIKFKPAPKQLSEVKYTKVVPHVFKFEEPFEVDSFEWGDTFVGCICLASINVKTDIMRVYYFCDDKVGNAFIRGMGTDIPEKWSIVHNNTEEGRLW